MRKVILLFTILFLVLLSAGATVTAPEGNAGSASFDSSSEGTITDVKAYLKATFKMDDESNSYVEIGFTKGDAPDDMSDSVASETDITLTADPDNAIAKYTATESEAFKVYYKIQYGLSDLTLKLSLADDLVLNSDSVTTPTTEQKLGWKVQVGGDGENNIASSASYDGGAKEATVIKHSKDTSFTTVGAKTLTIETSNYSGKNTGSYVGYIIANLSTT